MAFMLATGLACHSVIVDAYHGEGGIRRNFDSVSGRAVLDLDNAIRHAARPDNDLPRDANQINACQLRTRTLIPVIKQRVAPGASQTSIKILGAG
jgi:hypothetical protein